MIETTIYTCESCGNDFFSKDSIRDCDGCGNEICMSCWTRFFGEKYFCRECLPPDGE